MKWHPDVLLQYEITTRAGLSEDTGSTNSEKVQEKERGERKRQGEKGCQGWENEKKEKYNYKQNLNCPNDNNSTITSSKCEYQKH